MSIYNLSFGTIKVLHKNLAEVIVDEGVVMDEVIVAKFHDFLLKTLNAPFGVLINKKKSYSYTFEAQKKIVRLNEIKSTAVVANNSGAVMATETIININANNHGNIKLFQERDNALVWLKKELAQ